MSRISVPSPGCNSAIWSSVNSPCFVRPTIGFSSAMRTCVVRASRQINPKQNPGTGVPGFVDGEMGKLRLFVGLEGVHERASAALHGVTAVCTPLRELLRRQDLFQPGAEHRMH